jgi:hypothetical protein
VLLTRDQIVLCSFSHLSYNRPVNQHLAWPSFHPTGVSKS